MKKTILIDLDGVLNTYTGNYDENYIPPIKDGAYDFIKNISEKYKVKIFTSRKLFLASQWILNNNLEKYIDDVTNVKVPSFLHIDDRCITFKGNFVDLKDKIDNFEVWYK